jgi:hypothetical protein
MGAKRSEWVEKTAELLHPSVTYFQAVFTIPDRLSSLVLGNRRALYRLLFHASWDALRESIIVERGMEPAAKMVLHTWNQRLEHHPHVHALVPGCGPSLDGQRWVECGYTQGKAGKASKPFLVDNKRLGRRFRDRFLDGLEQLIKSGKVKVKNKKQLKKTLDELRACDWVVFIQPPPKDSTGPEEVLKYLARYMTGGPISDRRLIGIESGNVLFWARSNDKSGRQVEAKLPVVEFVRSWAIHILPKGFIKCRGFGGWSNANREAYMTRCQKLSPVSQQPPPQSAAWPTAEDVLHAERKCPHCQSLMELESLENRPSWRDLFYGPDHPRWFEHIYSD